MFSVLNATYLKTLPIAAADRFVQIQSRNGGAFTYPEYLALKDVPGLMAVIAGGRTSTTLDSAAGEGRMRQRVVIDSVTANYFDALGPRPGARGRLFTEADGRPSMPPVVVLSDAAWRKHFGSDVGVIGRTVRLHRGIFTIAGVAPDGFTGTQVGYSPDIWVPLTHATTHRRQRHDAWSRFRVARTERGARAARHLDHGARGDRWPMEGGPKW